MEHPVRKQLRDYIGRRNVTLPQFISTESMDRYFASIGVDGQREIVRGLLSCSDRETISEDIRRKITHLYNNLYLLKNPLKERQTHVIDSRGEKKRKVLIVKLIGENITSMKTIEQALKDSEEETGEKPGGSGQSDEK